MPDSTSSRSAQVTAFEDAARLLAEPDRVQDERARKFLDAVGFWPFGHETPPRHDRDHSVRLLLLASRLNSFFRLDSPFAKAAHFCGGVLPATDAMPAASCSGRGRTLGQAFASCIGEAAEASALYRHADDTRLSTNGMLNGVSLVTGAPVEMDALAVLRDASGRFPSSTGLAAGPTPGFARQAALLECIERDAIARWQRGEYQPSMLADTPETQAALNALGRTTMRPVLFADMTPPDGLAHCVVALSSDEGGIGTAFGFAAAFSWQDACLKSLLELCQGEIGLLIIARKLRDGGIERLAASEQRALQRARHYAPGDGLLHFAPPRLGIEVPASFDAAIAAIGARGADLSAFDLTLADNGVHVTRIVMEDLLDAATDVSDGGAEAASGLLS